MKTHLFPALLFSVAAFVSVACAAAEPFADNVRDFDAKTNDLSEGRWAYGWFNGGSINDPKKTLRLFTQAYPETRIAAPHWAVDPKKKELCWVVMADGRALTDGADIAWIYVVPAGQAGPVRITGRATSAAASKQLRVYAAKDEFLTGIKRAEWTPLFQQTGGDIDIDFTADVAAGTLLFFVQNDTATPANYRAAQMLKVRISPAK